MHFDTSVNDLQFQDHSFIRKQKLLCSFPSKYLNCVDAIKCAGKTCWFLDDHLNLFRTVNVQGRELYSGNFVKNIVTFSCLPLLTVISSPAVGCSCWLKFPGAGHILPPFNFFPLKRHQ